MKRAGAGKQQQNQTVLYGVLGVFLLGCVVYIYMQFAGGGPTTPPAPPVVTSAPVATRTTTASATSATAAAGGAKTGTRGTGSQLDPALHMDAMLVTESLEYAGSGRNIFSPNSAPPPPKPVAAIPEAARRLAETPAAPSGPPMPPPPPPINLKFFGTSTTPAGKRSAFLLQGDDVYHAGDGDIVGRKYKVITVGTTNVVVEDMSNNNRQTLPLETP